MTQEVWKDPAADVSVAHHGAVVQTFGFGFTNLFALYNAGAFAAGLSIIATDFGQRAYAKWPNLLPWTLILFSIGALASAGLMVIVFSYSLNRYRHYRSSLRGKSSEIRDAVHLEYSAKLALAVMVAFTVCATVFTFVIVFTTPLQTGTHGGS